MQVLVRARVGLYEARGDFQLIIEQMEPSGEGALRQAFEQLKAKLAAEGLFDTERKRPLPAFPRRIGVITSPTGAAVRDVLTVLKRRFPGIPVIVYPAQVQGVEAPRELTRALAMAEARGECDLLILTRGGGSLEDLMAFNDEGLARAIAACQTPLISAVGHEIDFTIADFVADQRAATPSAAAEIAVPSRDELTARLSNLEHRLHRRMDQRLQRAASDLARLSHRHQRLHPGVRLEQQGQRLDELERRLNYALRRRLERARERHRLLQRRVRALSPRLRLVELQRRLSDARRRLDYVTAERLAQPSQRLAVAARSLHNLSPLATLERGYSLTLRPDSGQLLRTAADLTPGDRLETRLKQGRVFSVIESVQPADEEA